MLASAFLGKVSLLLKPEQHIYLCGSKRNKSLDSTILTTTRQLTSHVRCKPGLQHEHVSVDVFCNMCYFASRTAWQWEKLKSTLLHGLKLE